MKFNTAAAPPPEAVLAGMAERLGFARDASLRADRDLRPGRCVNEWHGEWDDARPTTAPSARRRGRACAMRALEGADRDGPGDDGADAGRRRDDGRGHVPRQHRDEGVSRRTRRRPTQAFAGGWFHTGDLGVMHPDGYIQLQDRSKDIIISGGENISSIEVEEALYKHPAVPSVRRGGAAPTTSGARRRAPSSS